MMDLTDSEKQYIGIYEQCREMICSHSAPVMNAVRDTAFEHFRQQGFPTRKVERYKYTDMRKIFAPDYGLNLNRLDIPVNPYDAFRCDVPNLSTSLYFVINDVFNKKFLPKSSLPEGVIIGSLCEIAASSLPGDSTFHLRMTDQIVFQALCYILSLRYNTHTVRNVLHNRIHQ